MKHAPKERLRWRVLKQFGVLPGEARAKRMTERELLYCTLQLWLDEEEKLEGLCPACRQRALEERCRVCGAPMSETDGMENASFDPERFRELKEEGGA